MEKSKPSRGKDSFIPFIQFKDAQEKCSLKRHFRNAQREVIGYLDFLANKDPFGQRFVWAGIRDITMHCNRAKKKVKNPYSQKTIVKALQFLRDKGVITLSFSRNGQDGFQVLKHDDLAGMRFNHRYLCEWFGPSQKVPGSKLRVTNVVWSPNFRMGVIEE